MTAFANDRGVGGVTLRTSNSAPQILLQVYRRIYMEENYCLLVNVTESRLKINTILT